ncbi:hypothetical protein FOA52_007936 [Chlamydomonas sp. UWO 241]|nr:hypothetical protein FOA52_007936 [Chlamydomonas sp. UWO 241]
MEQMREQVAAAAAASAARVVEAETAIADALEARDGLQTELSELRQVASDRDQLLEQTAAMQQDLAATRAQLRSQEDAVGSLQQTLDIAQAELEHETTSCSDALEAMAFSVARVGAAFGGLSDRDHTKTAELEGVAVQLGCVAQMAATLAARSQALVDDNTQLRARLVAAASDAAAAASAATKERVVLGELWGARTHQATGVQAKHRQEEEEEVSESQGIQAQSGVDHFSTWGDGWCVAEAARPGTAGGDASACEPPPSCVVTHSSSSSSNDDRVAAPHPPVADDSTYTVHVMLRDVRVGVAGPARILLHGVDLASIIGSPSRGQPLACVNINAKPLLLPGGAASLALLSDVPSLLRTAHRVQPLGSDGRGAAACV